MSQHKQFERGSTSPSHRAISLTRSTVLDADAIKTTIATAATARSYTGAALNGADVGADHIARPTPSGHTGIAQYPVAVAAANAGSYVNGSLITFVGTYGGQIATRTATVSGTGGGATFVADGPLDTVDTVNVAAQADISGAWTFGFDDIACAGPDGVKHNNPFRWIHATSSGDMKITCGGGHNDTLYLVAGYQIPLEVQRVLFSDAATTVTTVRLLA